MLGLARKIARRLAEALKPEQVIVFGSVARGEIVSDSDIDLFVIWDPPEPLSNRQRRLHLRRIIGEMPVPLDILTCTRAELAQALTDPRSFTAQALAEGLILYEKNS